MLGITGKERKNIISRPGASRKGIPVDLVHEKLAQIPAGSKWGLINPTIPLLEVIDVRAEMTVEGRVILMMGPAKCDLTSLNVALSLAASCVNRAFYIFCHDQT